MESTHPCTATKSSTSPYQHPSGVCTIAVLVSSVDCRTPSAESTSQWEGTSELSPRVWVPVAMCMIDVSGAVYKRYQSTDLHGATPQHVEALGCDIITTGGAACLRCSFNMVQQPMAKGRCTPVGWWFGCYHAMLTFFSLVPVQAHMEDWHPAVPDPEDPEGLQMCVRTM